MRSYQTRARKGSTFLVTALMAGSAVIVSAGPAVALVDEVEVRPVESNLATKPWTTRSAAIPTTMGIVVVACWAARTAGVPEVRITSG